MLYLSIINPNPEPAIINSIDLGIFPGLPCIDTIYKPWSPPLVTITMQFGPTSSTPVLMPSNGVKPKRNRNTCAVSVALLSSHVCLRFGQVVKSPKESSQTIL